MARGHRRTGALPIRWPISLIRSTWYEFRWCVASLHNPQIGKRIRHSILDVLESAGPVPFRHVDLSTLVGCQAPTPERCRLSRARPPSRSPGSGPRGGRSAREIRSDPTLISRREIHAQKPGTVFRRQYRLSTQITLNTPPRSPRRRVRQDSHRSDSP